MAAQIYCSNCGNLIGVDSNYCRYCGAAQHGEASALYRAQAQPIEHVTTVSAPAVVQANTHTKHLEHEVIANRLLAPQAIWLFFINYNLRMIIVIPLLILGIYYQPLFIGIFAAYEIILFFIAWVVYNHFHFTIDKHGFQKEYGIIHKRGVTVPFDQIQNVNIIRTLIDRMLGIAKIEIETAGSSSIAKREIIGNVRSKAEGLLPGLTLADARHIHDVLLQKKDAS